LQVQPSHELIEYKKLKIKAIANINSASIDTS
jgi:hypothetical protein